jgi:carboxyl-terminal processing protease
MIDQDNGIGYVRLTNFTRESAHEVEQAIRTIRNANGKAIILDLRANPGGLLTAATEIADQFLSDGNIVSTRTAANIETSPPVDARPSRNDVTMPTVVLVNQYSASASEIVSGALKDHKRALIVGERTFGKGSVQMLYPIARQEAFLKLTTSHYYLPSGRCLHREEDSVDWGVDPDVAIDMTPEEMRNVLKLRQEMDVLRSSPATNPTTLPAEFKTREEQLLASDPQLGAAVLLLKMQLMGAPIL